MSGSVEGAVSASLAIKDFNMIQQKDSALLKQVLETQSATILGLLDAAIPPTGPQRLVFDGSIGTNIHVTV